MRRVSADRGNEHDDRDGGGRGYGGLGPGRADVPARQPARRCCACFGARIWSWCRALGARAAVLSGWREAFLAAGEASLATRPTDGEALESARLKTRLGRMLLERALLEARIAALEARDPRPLPRRRSRR